MDGSVIDLYISYLSYSTVALAFVLWCPIVVLYISFLPYSSVESVESHLICCSSGVAPVFSNCPFVLDVVPHRHTAAEYCILCFVLDVLYLMFRI